MSVRDSTEVCGFGTCALPVGHKPEPHSNRDMVTRAEAVYEALRYALDWRHEEDERETYLRSIRHGLRKWEDQQSSPNYLNLNAPPTDEFEEIDELQEYGFKGGAS